MKKLVLASAALALVLTTGFTCSKNAPEQAATTAPAEQAPMAAPAPAPASGDATAPAPAAAPATETK